jgi:3-isopropylmalate/(R)-2-methylmalate dehydratase small subunit
MTPFTSFTSRVVVLPADDVDTDQIIPARFLKGTSKTGLSAHLFADWRAQPDFPLLAPDAAGARILLAGANFGCGSSREHAPWALVDWGFRAIIARSFADIFKENATKNGLLTIALPDEACAHVEHAVRADRAVEVHVDLEQIVLPGGATFAFALNPFAKHCLATGLDELGYILSFAERITDHERRTSI